MNDRAVGQSAMLRESQAEKAVETIRIVWDKFSDNRSQRAYWDTKNSFRFSSTDKMLMQRMTTDMKGYDEDVKKHSEKHSALELLCSERIISNPTFATSDLPIHAMKYGFGLKPFAGMKDFRLLPQYSDDGKPMNRHVGKIFIALLTPAQMKLEHMRHVTGAR